MKRKKSSMLKKFLTSIPLATSLALGAHTSHAGWENQGYVHNQTGEIVQQIPQQSSITINTIENNFNNYFDITETQTYLGKKGETIYRHTISDKNNSIKFQHSTLEKNPNVSNILDYIKNTNNSFYNSIINKALKSENYRISGENVLIHSQYSANQVFNYTGSQEDNDEIFTYAINMKKTGEEYGSNATYSSYEEFKTRIKELIGNEADSNKIRSFLKYTYKKLYVRYDKNVALGHSKGISLEEYYLKAIINGEYIGNCGDISCGLLDISKDVFNIGGIVIHSGIHMAAVFEMNDGLYNPEIRKVSKNLQELIDTQEFPTVSNFFSTCSDALVGELQTLFQKKYEKNVSPFGLTSYTDFIDKKKIEGVIATDLDIFILGGPEKQISTLKLSLGHDYNNRFFSGSFNVAFSLSHQESSLYDTLDLASVSFVDNGTYKIDDEGKLIIGNFIKGFASLALGGKIGIGYNDLNPIIGHDTQLRDQVYILYKHNNSLYYGLSLGAIFQTKTVSQDQSITAHKIIQWDVGYKFKGVKLKYTGKHLGETTNHDIEFKSRVGNHEFGANVLKTSSNNNFLDRYASEIQSELQYSFNKWGLRFGVDYQINEEKVIVNIRGNLF